MSTSPSPRKACPRRPASCALLALLLGLAACGTGVVPKGAIAPPAPGARPSGEPASGSASAVLPLPATPGAPATAAATAPLATGAAEVKTRNAVFKPARFDELPGWADDDLAGAWDAFRASCRALDRREAWKPVCAAFDKLPRRSADMRRFFEREFALFQITDTDASRDGDVTGYYEPLIAGSTRAEAPYTVPVYGPPRDLCTIDWKTIPAGQRRGVVQLVRVGQELVVVPSPRAGSVALDASQFALDTRDRRWRVRVDGRTARPYPTREQIEAAGGIDAPVIAWVDDPLALYAMQVQGSGRIQLRDGRVLRLQYAEQNGHPFRPLRVVPRPERRIATRSLGAGPAADTEGFELEDESAGADGGNGGGNEGGSAPMTRAMKPAFAASPATPSKAGGVLAALRSDPSYVFFRVAADQSPLRGPVGALGVPLSAGRSIAVDPRITPMGYPVYMSAPTAAAGAAPLQRLVVAQDTGGAIRGALRADFFWGFGHEAGRQAMRTRQRGQMWLLLPRSEAATLLGQGRATRSWRPAGSASGAECLLPDPAFCTEAD
jgi:membrane-bound lytic murein transglycosylase A